MTTTAAPAGSKAKGKPAAEPALFKAITLDDAAAAALTAHPAADMLPMMGDADFERHIEDIRGQGVLDPITVWREPDGAYRLVDGRNRHKAWMKLREEGVRVRLPVREISGTEGDLVAYVAASGVNRRQMSSGQVACSLVKLSKYAAGLGPAGRKVAEGIVPRTRRAGTNHSYYYQASNLYDQAPDLFSSVLADSMSMNAAFKELERRQADALKPPAAVVPDAEDAAPDAAPDGTAVVPEPPEAKDATGAAVPSHLVPVFLARAEWQALRRKLVDVRDDVANLIPTASAAQAQAKELLADVRRAITLINAGMPHAYCRPCGGTGSPPAGGVCATCNGHSFLNRGQFRHTVAAVVADEGDEDE